jgi:xylulokinase
MTQRLVAGVDSSTQSCKVELRLVEDGALVGSGSAPHPPATPPASEQDPYAWWEAFRAAFTRAMSSSSAPPGVVRAISVAAQCHGLVVLDDEDRVIRPALTGRAVTDRSEASGTAYFDAAADEYVVEYLERIAHRDWLPMLPEVLGPEGVAGEVKDAVLMELGLSGSVFVGAGGGDQHAAALGLGMVPGDITYSFGTSGVVMTVSEQPVYDEQGHVDGVADMTNGYLPLVSTLNAAKVTDTFARILGVTHPQMSALALAAPAQQDALVLVAYLDGERTPNRPGASGLLSGLTTQTTRREIARAAYEGVIFGLYAGQRSLERVGVRLGGRVLAVGGGARSEAYTQLLADIVGAPVMLPDASEATARGAAVQAAAVASGQRVTAVRDAWAPATRTVAKPRACVGRHGLVIRQPPP